MTPSGPGPTCRRSTRGPHGANEPSPCHAPRCAVLAEPPPDLRCTEGGETHWQESDAGSTLHRWWRSPEYVAAVEAEVAAAPDGAGNWRRDPHEVLLRFVRELDSAAMGSCTSTPSDPIGLECSILLRPEPRRVADDPTVGEVLVFDALRTSSHDMNRPSERHYSTTRYEARLHSAGSTWWLESITEEACEEHGFDEGGRAAAEQVARSGGYTEPVDAS